MLDYEAAIWKRFRFFLNQGEKDTQEVKRKWSEGEYERENVKERERESVEESESLLKRMH